MKPRRHTGDLVAVDPSGLGDLAELRLQLAALDVAAEHEAHVAGAVRVDEDQPLDADVETGLLERLPHGCRVWRLAALDPAPRQHPAGTEVGGAHHEDASLRIGGKDMRAFDAAVAATEQPGECDRAADDEPRKVGRAGASAYGASEATGSTGFASSAAMYAWSRP